MLEINWQPGQTLEELEKQAILMAFRFFRGNKTQTARSLDIAIRTLDQKLENYQNANKIKEEADAKHEEQRRQFQLKQRGISVEVGAGPSIGERQIAWAKSDQGGGIQPVAEAPAKHEVPVPVGQKIQGVSLKSVTVSGQTKRR